MMKFFQKRIQNKNRAAGDDRRGFTIIEVMVSLSIFIIVMTVSAGALLSIIDANRRSHQLKSVIDNLNFALEDMARNMRVGTNFICAPTVSISAITTPPTVNPSSPTAVGGQDCINPDSSVQNQNFEYTDTTGIQTLYFLYNNHIYSSTKNNSGVWSVPSQLTADQVFVSDMRFYVNGAPNGASGDKNQPRALITVDGYAGQGKYQSTFSLQTSVAQRIYDQ